MVKHDIHKIIEQFEKASEVNFIDILKDGFEKPETVADSTVLYMDTSVLSGGLPDDTEEKKAVVLFGPLSLIPEPLISRGIIYAYDLSNKIQTQKNSLMM